MRACDECSTEDEATFLRFEADYEKLSRDCFGACAPAITDEVLLAAAATSAALPGAPTAIK